MSLLSVLAHNGNIDEMSAVPTHIANIPLNLLCHMRKRAKHMMPRALRALSISLSLSLSLSPIIFLSLCLTLSLSLSLSLSHCISVCQGLSPIVLLSLPLDSTNIPPTTSL